jgi:hypothetical protein
LEDRRPVDAAAFAVDGEEATVVVSGDVVEEDSAVEEAEEEEVVVAVDTIPTISDIFAS